MNSFNIVSTTLLFLNSFYAVAVVLLLAVVVVKVVVPTSSAWAKSECGTCESYKKLCLLHIKLNDLVTLSLLPTFILLTSRFVSMLIFSFPSSLAGLGHHIYTHMRATYKTKCIFITTPACCALYLLIVCKHKSTSYQLWILREIVLLLLVLLHIARKYICSVQGYTRPGKLFHKVL